MNQSIFLVENSFFENSFQNIELVANEIKSHCQSEKLCLVFDPVSLPLFNTLAKYDQNLLEDFLVRFFKSFESLNNKLELPWYCLDDKSSYYIESLVDLIIELDYQSRGIYAFGLIPIVFDNYKFFVYFFISPYDIPDIYKIVSTQDYNKRFQVFLKEFNNIPVEDKK